LDMPALALTDQSNLFALVKFYRAAEANGIKPVAGADLWIADAAEAGGPARLTVLCQNRRGYLNLAQLISRSYTDGRHGDHAIVQPHWFDEHSDGLIALAGRDSDVGRLLRGGRDEAALARMGDWLRRFDERWYFELTRCGRGDDESWIDLSLQLADAV